MTKISNTKLISSALVSAALAFGTSTSQAADNPGIGVMKPLHGISFKVGTQQAVSYFIAEQGKCQLVLTLAEEPNWDNVKSFATTRFEATVPAGEATHIHSNGKALVFACERDAGAMSVVSQDQVADTPVK